MVKDEGMISPGAVQFPLAPPSVSGALGKGFAAGTENAAQEGPFSLCTSLYGSSCENREGLKGF